MPKHENGCTRSGEGVVGGKGRKLGGRRRGEEDEEEVGRERKKEEGRKREREVSGADMEVGGSGREKGRLGEEEVQNVQGRHMLWRGGGGGHEGRDVPEVITH